MFSPVTIANYFVAKSWESGEALTPMKLVKLVYIAHGYHLAITGKPLLTEPAMAWKYGPVVLSVYHNFKEFGGDPITEMKGRSDIESDWNPSTLGEMERRYLDLIYNRYKHLNGLQLSTLTHMVDTPWYITWHDNGGCNQHNAVIPNDLIEEHYKKLLNEQRERPAVG